MPSIVYIAGPYRGANAWEIENNIRAAEGLALQVWQSGNVALCPHAMTRYYQDAAPDTTWLVGDLLLLMRCDAVLLVEGWANSSGTLLEIAVADRLNIPIYQRLQDVGVLDKSLQAGPYAHLLTQIGKDQSEQVDIFLRNVADDLPHWLHSRYASLSIQ